MKTQTEFPERYITLGLKISYYRRKAGYTQEYFAELIDKSVSFVGQVEGPSTISGVSLETLFKMAQVLKIPPSKLLEDD
ncbi:MAG: helix-turn-helix transcriptional regulator [Clostridia bacterium]|nr:helix-turn-helix transcriptional regulator [Clostridia bacterium]